MSRVASPIKSKRVHDDKLFMKMETKMSGIIIG